MADAKPTAAAAGAASPSPASPPAPTTSSSNVLGRALRGGSYLFLQKIFTFAINSFILRRLHLSVTGAVTVQFELALATVFLFRDSFRLAFLRMPSLVEPSSTPASPLNRTQRIVNVAWISTLGSWMLGLLIVLVVAVRGAQPDGHAQKGLEGYARVLAMYCGAAMIEASAEPMYLLAHSSVLVGWQVSAQGMAFLTRAIVQYAGIFVFQWDGLLCYGFAELAYATTQLVVFLWFFYWKLHENRSTNAQGLQHLSQLLPRPASGPSGLFDAELLAILLPLSVQSVVKYLLTEGDKWVLSLFTTLEQMGVYGIVFHLGSLVPRIVFFPLEEATKTVISKMEASNESQVAQAKRFVLMLLKLMHLVGLVFVCFGTNYAYTLIVILYGVEKAQSGVGASLAAYCLYIPFLGLNGICEAFVHAVGDTRQLMRLNQLMGVFFVIYAASAMLFMWGLQLGTVGIIFANCVNMSCRILYCMSFIAMHFFSHATMDAKKASPRPSPLSVLLGFWREALPDRLVMLAFGASFLVGGLSQRLVLVNDAWIRHGAHVGIGGVCFAVVLAALYLRERKLVREELRHLRSGGVASPPASKKDQ
jgi:oligosaccharide translocation protein RFT1